jgi:hypothetical protein
VSKFHSIKVRSKLTSWRAAEIYLLKKLGPIFAESGLWEQGVIKYFPRRG